MIKTKTLKVKSIKDEELIIAITIIKIINNSSNNDNDNQKL